MRESIDEKRNSLKWKNWLSSRQPIFVNLNSNTMKNTLQMYAYNFIYKQNTQEKRLYLTLFLWFPVFIAICWICVTKVLHSDSLILYVTWFYLNFVRNRPIGKRCCYKIKIKMGDYENVFVEFYFVRRACRIECLWWGRTSGLSILAWFCSSIC